MRAKVVRWLAVGVASAFGPMARAGDLGLGMTGVAAGPSAHHGEASVQVDIGGPPSGALRIGAASARDGLGEVLDVDVGVTDALSVQGFGALSEVSSGFAGAFGAGAQVTFLRPDPSVGGFSLAGTLGVHREWSGGVAGTLDAQARYARGLVVVDAAARVEHRFVVGSDPVDVIVPVDVAVRAGRVELGAAYVGQDLEAGLDDDDAEGGAVHVVAATAGLDVGRWRIGGDVGVAAGPAGVGPLARATAALTW